MVILFGVWLCYVIDVVEKSFLVISLVLWFVVIVGCIMCVDGVYYVG